jgi:hypothetical protein
MNGIVNGMPNAGHGSMKAMYLMKATCFQLDR